MHALFIIFGSGLLTLLALARLLFLGRYRLGWVMYLANVVWESADKILGGGRFRLECMAAVLGLLLLLAGGVPWGITAILGLLLLVSEGINRSWERRILSAAYTGPKSVGPAPSVRPELVLTIDAPFIDRLPRYQLGLLWVGVPFDFEVIVGNHTSIPTQTPVQIHLSVPSTWISKGIADVLVGPVPAGTVSRVKWTLCPDESRGAGRIDIRVEWDGGSRHISIGYDGCQCAENTKIVRAAIERYPGGRRSAFAWRGDMDLYDTTMMQSIEGLETALSLAARYAFPQTMCLSTRLSLDEEAARGWALHYGVDRGASEIPRFIQWLREYVELRHAGAYPVTSSKHYFMELGNHGHLHYDTATSAAPENGWRSHARMGAGHYGWMGDDTSSFGEQRDNVVEANRWCNRLFNITPRTWAKPGRGNDADTPRAVEAAGCEVLSGSDIRARDNVLFQPPPHHPEGTDAVELTSRFPCDPQHVFHLGMLLFWLHRSQRLGLPMVYMCHQHMRQFEGIACTRFTEYLLHTVLVDFQGEFYIDTLFGIGKYWREVLSQKTRRVKVTLEGTQLLVENRSDIDFDRVPVDLSLAGGGRATILVSIRSGMSKKIELTPTRRVEEI